MQMEHSEYLKLQEQLQDHFDGRYRKIADCDDISENIDKKVSKDNVRLAVIEQQNKLMLWILAAVSGGIITMLVKMFFGG
jgi:hypothetical protein